MNNALNHCACSCNIWQLVKIYKKSGKNANFEPESRLQGISSRSSACSPCGLCNSQLGCGKNFLFSMNFSLFVGLVPKCFGGYVLVEPWSSYSISDQICVDSALSVPYFIARKIYAIPVCVIVEIGVQTHSDCTKNKLEHNLPSRGKFFAGI